MVDGVMIYGVNVHFPLIIYDDDAINLIHDDVIFII